MRFKEGDVVEFQGMHNWDREGCFTVGKEYTVDPRGCVLDDYRDATQLHRTTDNNRIYNFRIAK